MTGTCAGAVHKKHVPLATTGATTTEPDSWWIPAAFLLPAFITADAIARIEAACETFGDVGEEQATA